MKAFLLPLIPLLLLSGCATRTVQIEPKRVANLKPGYGLLVGTYSRADPKERFDSETVEFRKTTGGRFYHIGIDTLPMVPLKFDFQDAFTSGMLFVMALPAGDYEITGFSVVDSTWGGQVTYYPRTKFSIPFSVAEGKVNYLGEILMDRIHGPSLLGLRSSESVHFDISNKIERDRALFHEKYPNVSLSWEVVVPRAGHSNPYFRIIEDASPDTTETTDDARRN